MMTVQQISNAVSLETSDHNGKNPFQDYQPDNPEGNASIPYANSENFPENGVEGVSMFDSPGLPRDKYPVDGARVEKLIRAVLYCGSKSLGLTVNVGTELIQGDPNATRSDVWITGASVNDGPFRP